MSINDANFPGEVWDGGAPNRSDRLINASPDYEDWDQIVAEVIAVQDYLVGPQESGVGTAGANILAETSRGSLQVTQLALTDVPISMVDHTTAGCHGSAVIYAFPAGNVLVLGAVCDLEFTNDPEGGIDEDAVVVTAIGSAAVGIDNAALTALEANVIPSMASTLVGDVGPGNGQSTAPVTLDGTSSAVTLKLNVAAAADDASADGFISASGTVTLTWVLLGDN